MYGAETWPIKGAKEKRLDVAEMNMLRWMCGVTKFDRIRNERIRGTTKVVEISKNIQERRFQWYGQVMRRDKTYVGRRVMEEEVQGRRGIGRPRQRWIERVRKDL